MEKHSIYQTSLNNALVRILKGDSRMPVGAGFLVTPRHVLTCAHVICDALDLPILTQNAPDRQVRFDFPIIEHQPIYSANVVTSKWYPYFDNPVIGELEDMALLELTPETVLTDKACPAPVVILEEFFNREIRMCGFPSGMDHGSWGVGKLRDMIACGWVQLDSELDSHSVKPGFSGTPVWDNAERAVVGMITRRLKQNDLTSGYMIPGKTIIKAFPKLDQHSRPRNPYKGLEAFHEQDAPFFFGRETVVEELSEIVQTQPFVPVIGASGSGKSSLIFAGLIPKLRAAGGWIIRDFRPKDNPFYHLSLSLIPLLYKDKLEQVRKAKELAYDFAQAKTGIADIIQMIAQEHPRQKLLLIADQFEELFTANPDQSVRHRFMDTLIEPLSGSSLPFAFLFTMRADFMSQAVG